jgi:hypothetical protein
VNLDASKTLILGSGRGGHLLEVVAVNLDEGDDP